MQITYTLTEEDKEKYLKSNFDTKKRTVPKVMVFLGSFVLLLILFMALIAKDYSFTVPLSIFLVFILLILYYPKQLKKKYIKGLNSNDERSIELKESALVVSSSTRETSYSYTDIKKVDFINDYFVLIEFKLGDSIVIPKSAFQDNLNIITFINLIKTNAHIL